MGGHGEIMQNQIMKLMEKYGVLVNELIEEKSSLTLLENELKKEEAKINLFTKEQWKELGISNAEGRKAYIQVELGDLKLRIEEKRNKVAGLEITRSFLVKKVDVLCMVMNADEVRKEHCCNCNEEELVDSHELLTGGSCY